MFNTMNGGYSLHEAATSKKMKRYAELIGNYKNYKIKNLQDNMMG